MHCYVRKAKVLRGEVKCDLLENRQPGQLMDSIQTSSEIMMLPKLPRVFVFDTAQRHRRLDNVRKTVRCFVERLEGNVAEECLPSTLNDSRAATNSRVTVIGRLVGAIGAELCVASPGPKAGPRCTFILETPYDDTRAIGTTSHATVLCRTGYSSRLKARMISN